MADNGQRVTLEAIFKSTGLDRLGRQFDQVSQRMRRMGDVFQAWGGGRQVRQDFAKQFQIGAELQESQQRLRRARELYRRIADELNRVDDPRRRERLQQHLGTVVMLGQRELDLQRRLTHQEQQKNTEVMRGLTLRRMMRLGLGVLGLPMTMGAAGRSLSEASEQERGVLAMATRLRELNAPIKDFTEYTQSLRRAIVDAGAEFGYSGREAIALADSLQALSGNLISVKDVYGMARGFGMNPQVVGQYVAMARRLGGRDAPSDERLMNVVARGISASQMGTRPDEFAQAVASAMQIYSSRLPAVDPGMLTTVLAALSAEVNPFDGGRGVGRYAPTLRGQGGMQVIEGLTAMMSDNSEAMIAMQTELLSRDPAAFSKTMEEMGIRLKPGETLGGADRLLLLNTLKQAGVADPDGLKLAGKTIKEISGVQNRSTRILLETYLLRLSPQLVNALEKGGFMTALREGRVTEASFQNFLRNQAMGQQAQAMRTPAMQWQRLRTQSSAQWARVWAAGLKGTADIFEPGAIAEQMEGGMGLWRAPSMMLGAAGQKIHERGQAIPMAAGAIGALVGLLGGPGISAGLGATMYGFGHVGQELYYNPKHADKRGQIKHTLDIAVSMTDIVGTAANLPFEASALGMQVGRGVVDFLKQNIMNIMQSANGNVEVGGMGHNIGHDRHGNR